MILEYWFEWNAKLWPELKFDAAVLFNAAMENKSLDQAYQSTITMHNEGVMAVATMDDGHRRAFEKLVLLLLQNTVHPRYNWTATPKD